MDRIRLLLQRFDRSAIYKGDTREFAFSTELLECGREGGVRGERAVSTLLVLMWGCPEALETVAWREVGAEEVSVSVRHVHIVITLWQGMCHPGRREMREPTNELGESRG